MSYLYLDNAFIFSDTSREKRQHEEDGKEYKFLSREDMENQIIAQK